MSFSSNLNHYGMVHVASVSDVLLDTSFTPPCQRMGAMVAFRSFQEFTRWDPLLLGLTAGWNDVQKCCITCTCLPQEHKWCVELLLWLTSSESNLPRGGESCPVWRRGQQGEKKRPKIQFCLYFHLESICFFISHKQCQAADTHCSCLSVILIEHDFA